ncbi:DUF4339 domain-containing protein [Rosistilla oblonga]|uniref:DUF4339 domain-containing protein n=1 Tax=Rosistilla oblonga TaxID=2527990 RepID=UPI003A970956
MDMERIQSLAQKGQLSRIHEVSSDGHAWQPASSMPEIFEKKRAATAELAGKVAVNQLNAAPQAVAQNGIQPSGVGSGIAPQQRQEWHYTAGGLQAGPITASELGTLIRAGSVTQQDLVWKDPMEQWTEAKYVPEFAMLFAASQQAQTLQPSTETRETERRDPNRIYPPESPRNPVVMAMCSFLLMGLGQIIMGQTAKGFLIMFSILLTCGVFLFVTPIVGPIDAYLIAKKLEAGKSVGKWEWF